MHVRETLPSLRRMRDETAKNVTIAEAMGIGWAPFVDDMREQVRQLDAHIRSVALAG